MSDELVGRWFRKLHEIEGNDVYSSHEVARGFIAALSAEARLDGALQMAEWFRKVRPGAVGISDSVAIEHEARRRFGKERSQPAHD